MRHSGEHLADGRVAVIGLGYVGLTLAVSFAAAGFPVIGVESDPRTRDSLSAGRSTLFEPGISELLRSLPAGRFTVTEQLSGEPPSAIVICVGTPVDPDTKQPDLRQLEAAVAAAAGHIR